MPLSRELDTFFASGDALTALGVNVYDKTFQVVDYPGLTRENIAFRFFCNYTNYVLFRELRSMGIHGELWEYMEDEVHERRIHAFVNIPPDGMGEPGYIVDFSYKVFVPSVAVARDLPNGMVIPYTSHDDVVSGLQRHKINPRSQYRWLDPLFNPAKANLVRKTVSSSQGVVRVK